MHAGEMHDARSLFADFEPACPRVLLLEEGESSIAWRFPDGPSYKKFVDECPGFDAYLTDDACDYLFCVNHHGVLLAAGRCVPWARSLPDQQPRS